VTRHARLGMNGPDVIEQEAGVAELDASDRALIWSLIGGEQRHAVGLADYLVEDDATAIAVAVRDAMGQGLPPLERSAQVARFIERLSRIDPRQPLDARVLRTLWKDGSLP